MEDTGTGVTVYWCLHAVPPWPFNRYLDRDIDQDNPRTAVREIPAGIINARSALLFVVINSLLFIVCAGLINQLCLILSPVALLVILGYSFTKRFTSWCHFVLGLGLSLAPVGAYLAVTGSFQLIPILYGFVVLVWVAGFDIIYALQDEEFDREHALQSIPVRMGRVGALRLSNGLHFLCGLDLIAGGLPAIAGFRTIQLVELAGRRDFSCFIGLPA